MNVLILAAGTRNKIVSYFKSALNKEGTVVAADASALAPAIYEADRRYIVPIITNPGYVDRILEICESEKINGLLSLIDPELSILAENEERFRKAGVSVIGSSYELCELSLDKYRMYCWLKEHHYNCALSWPDTTSFYQDLERGAAAFPVFVKPVKGSASLNIFQAADREVVEYLMAHQEGLMIQECMKGTEIGADVYIDMISGDVVSIFTKKKIKMRAGETDKAVSFKDGKLFELIVKFVTEAGFRGPVDIDLFEKEGIYYISEVNPRFGGGYPHAYESGCDFMSMILANLGGKVNVNQIGMYEDDIYMMKYSDVTVRKMKK